MQRLCERVARYKSFYLITHERIKNNIASDAKITFGMVLTKRKYPILPINTAAKKYKANKINIVHHPK